MSQADQAGSLAELYRQTVLDHSRSPRNFRRLPRPDRQAEGHNTLCGDKVTVYLRLDGDRLGDVAFEGTGCAISLASASLMTEAVQGLDAASARDTAGRVLGAFGGSSGPELPLPVAALGGVRAYPSRVRCATLPWQTLAAALEGRAGTVSTEPEPGPGHG